MPVLEETQEVWGIRTVNAGDFTAVRITRETAGRVYYRAQESATPLLLVAPKSSFLDVRGPERVILDLVHRLNSSYAELVQRELSAQSWWVQRRAEILGQAT